MNLSTESISSQKIRSSSNMILCCDRFMDVKKEKKIKAQEWVVMFDGQIKRSEKEFDADHHHLDVKTQEND